MIPDLDRPKLVWLAALGASLLTLYHLFLLPDIPAQGDAAKLQAVAAVLGTPHPSGYPTWVLSAHILGKLLPWASPAYAANLMTALFSIAGTCFLFLALLELRVSRAAAAAASLALALSPTLWSQSVLAEVYSLNYLFLTAVAFCLLRWKRCLETGDPAQLFLLFGLAAYGLSFTNHLTTACSGLGIAAFVLLVRPQALKSLSVAGALVLSGTVALALYGYILWRSHSPDVPFLETQAADWRSLLGQLAGDPKRRHLFETSLGTVLGERLPALFGRLWNELYFLLPVALLGLRKVSAPIHLFLGLVALGNLAFALSFTVPDKFVYFIPVYVVVAIYLGLGFDFLLRRFPTVKGLPAAAVLSALLVGALGFPKVRAQHEFLLREASRLDDLFDRLGEDPAVVLSDRYGTSMGLLHRSLLEKPRIRVHHLPPVSYEIPLALAPVRRYLEEDLPLRSASYPRAFPPGHPVYCVCVEPSRLGPHGIDAENLGGGLYRLEASASPPPAIPRARLVFRLDTVRDMVSAIGLLRADPRDPEATPRTAVFLGSAPKTEILTADPDPQLEILTADDQRIELVAASRAPGWLVLAEPLGARWQVTLDGLPAKRLELDLLFSGVAVPAGESRVVFSSSLKEP